jgi:hypothetical protein
MRVDRIKSVSNQGPSATTARTPWSYIVRALVHESDEFDTNELRQRGHAVSTASHIPSCKRRDARLPSDVPDVLKTNALVRVLERCSESSVVILWQDATRCNYGNQIWCRSRATKKGICALSGKFIKRGDPIYHPSLRPCPPANAYAVILASVIDCEDLVGDLTGD